MRELSPGEQATLRTGRCVYCCSSAWLEGPHGGMSINIYCGECGAGFNMMGPFGGQLIREPTEEAPRCSTRPMPVYLYEDLFTPRATAPKRFWKKVKQRWLTRTS